MTWTYSSAGLVASHTYHVNVRVDDGNGSSAVSYIPRSPLRRCRRQSAPVATYTISEGQSLTLAGSGTELSGDPLSYTWDINGDGTFYDATGATPTLTWPQLNYLGITNGPATFNVTLRTVPTPPRPGQVTRQPQR